MLANNQNAPIKYGSSFTTGAQLGTGAAEQVVSPASNVNGLIVWAAEYISIGGVSPSFVSLLAKTSAPTNHIDGDGIPMVSSAFENPSSTITGSCGRLNSPVYIPPGKGLYFRVMTGNESNSHVRRSVLFTLL